MGKMFQLDFKNFKQDKFRQWSLKLPRWRKKEEKQVVDEHLEDCTMISWQPFFSKEWSPVVQHTEDLYEHILKSNNSHDNRENERFTFLQLDHM